MASKSFYFKGMLKWAKVHTPDDMFDVYTLDLHLNDESKKLFKDSELQLKVRESEDGEYIKLRRPVSKKINNEVVDIGPPTVMVFNEDTGEYENTKKLIGNGSTGACKVRVYDTPRGKGHELVAVFVDDLVEYETKVGGEEYPF